MIWSLESGISNRSDRPSRNSQGAGRMTMRRTPYWPAALCVGLSLATLVVVGCTGRTPPAAAVPAKGANGGASEGGDAAGGGSAAESNAKPLANFPDDLAGVLLISGEMVGYTEPCGCTAGQKGG